MTLPAHDIIFKRRLARYERNFLFYYGNRGLSRYEQWYRLEGLISQTWQSWCQFCRSIVIESCLGTEALGGRAIARANQSWIDEQRVIYEAGCAVKGQPPRAGARIINSWAEITWGDIDKLVIVVGALNPTNRTELLNGFGGGLSGPKHLQIVRNASAHINRDNATSINRLAAYYYGNPIKHPTDLATRSHILTKDPAFISWISDMKLMSDVCVQ